MPPAPQGPELHPHPHSPLFCPEIMWSHVLRAGLGLRPQVACGWSWWSRKEWQNPASQPLGLPASRCGRAVNLYGCGISTCALGGPCNEQGVYKHLMKTMFPHPYEGLRAGTMLSSHSRETLQEHSLAKASPSSVLQENSSEHKNCQVWINIAQSLRCFEHD